MVSYGMEWYGAIWYGMVRYGMVWHFMVWCSMVWYGMVWYGMVWYSMVWYGMVWYSMVWYGMVWYGMVRYGMVRYGMASYIQVTETKYTYIHMYTYDMNTIILKVYEVIGCIEGVYVTRRVCLRDTHNTKRMKKTLHITNTHMEYTYVLWTFLSHSHTLSHK